MLSHLFSTVGCKTRLNRRHPEDQSRTCMSCVNSRPLAEATGPEAMRRGRPGDPRGGSRGQPLPAARVAPEGASPGFLGHVVGAISNANVSGVGSFLPITVHFWHKLAKHLRRPASRRAPAPAHGGKPAATVGGGQCGSGTPFHPRVSGLPATGLPGVSWTQAPTTHRGPFACSSFSLPATRTC